MRFPPLFRGALLIGLALALLMPQPAFAAQQAPVSFSAVLVDIWPEYDQPNVLVMYHLTLAPSVTLPATLSVRIPAGAGQPHAVAMQDVSGLYDLNYTLGAAGEWIEVQFTTPVPDVRIEFYDPALQKDGAQRSYTFRWPGSYEAQNLTLRVQQPVDASGMTFRPDIGGGRPDTDGLTYYTLLAGQVRAGEAFELAMGYQKSSDALTNQQQFQPAQPSQPVDGSTPGRITLFQGLSMTPLQLAMLAIGLGLIAGGLFWYWLTSRAARPAGSRAPGRRRHARTAAGAQSGQSARGGQGLESSADDDPVFCHQCGKRSGPADLFCRACGTELQR